MKLKFCGLTKINYETSFYSDYYENTLSCLRS